MLQLNTLVRFIHSHSPARLSKFKKILARRPKSVPTPVLGGLGGLGGLGLSSTIIYLIFEIRKLAIKQLKCKFS